MVYENNNRRSFIDTESWFMLGNSVTENEGIKLAQIDPNNVSKLITFNSS